MHSDEFNKMPPAEKAQGVLDLVSEDAKALGILSQHIVVHSWLREFEGTVLEAGNNEAVCWSNFLASLLDAMLDLTLIHKQTAVQIDKTLRADPIWISQKNREKAGVKGH